jgi:hypothetical protein
MRVWSHLEKKGKRLQEEWKQERERNVVLNSLESGVSNLLHS